MKMSKVPRAMRLQVALPVLASFIGAGPSTAAAMAQHAAADRPLVVDAKTRCAEFAGRMSGRWPDSTTQIISTDLIAAGKLPTNIPGTPTVQMVNVPEHCELQASVQQRLGEGGQHYAIRFHLRLPTDWNGRFLFQGGGGSNGVVGDALGNYSPTAAPALTQGFAVVSQDSGHDNHINNDPARGGVLMFGFDQQARANYGYASLPIVAQAAKAAIATFYSKPAQYSYFVGCSKGGEEGMALAQRYAREFDGIAAGAPGMSLPRAAIAEAWDTQAFAALIKTSPGAEVPWTELPRVFSDTDLGLVRTAVLAVCDGDDGLKDGMVGAFDRCTTRRVRPALEARRCVADKSEGCLSARQIEALITVMSGAHDRAGTPLYSDWPWDAGIGLTGWRLWKLGMINGSPPAFNVVLGGASLAAVFTMPPTTMAADPQTLMNYLSSFDFDRDAPSIYATNDQFPRSAWEDISARSSDLNAFRWRQGKMIVTHGVSDPVFSINDTISWWREVDHRNGGQAAKFVRLFPVPGMNHCGGGDATDQYDVLAPLMRWVEHGHAPEKIVATASSNSPWPERSRPLCPYPTVARYRGGDAESADSFVCRQ
jgi:feruloyl esterase